MAKKNNTDSWLSVNKQGYTVVCEVYITFSLFERKRILICILSELVPCPEYTLVYSSSPTGRGNKR